MSSCKFEMFELNSTEKRCIEEKSHIQFNQLSYKNSPKASKQQRRREQSRINRVECKELLKTHNENTIKAKRIRVWMVVLAVHRLSQSPQAKTTQYADEISLEYREREVYSKWKWSNTKIQMSFLKPMYSRFPYCIRLLSTSILQRSFSSKFLLT